MHTDTLSLRRVWPQPSAESRPDFLVCLRMSSSSWATELSDELPTKLVIARTTRGRGPLVASRSPTVSNLLGRGKREEEERGKKNIYIM